MCTPSRGGGSRWPEGLRKFVFDVLFWNIRVTAWYQLLADPYPAFSIG